MSWYWWLSIFIYVNGSAFTAGASIHEYRDGEILQTVLLVFLWPIAIAGVAYEMLNECYKFSESRIWFCFKFWFDKIKNWQQNRKEDKIFHEKHLDNKFERLGLKFDDNDDVWRS